MVLFSLSFVILLSILSLSLSQAWEAQYFDSATSTTPITSLTIHKGAYTPLFIKFSLISGQAMTKVSGTLSISDKEFKLSDAIVVDPYKDRFIKVFIGLSCISEGAGTEIKFLIEGRTDLISLPSLQATISAVSTKFEVKPLTKSTMTEGIGFYQISGETYNVDAIQVSFKTVAGSGTIESFTLTSYTRDRNSKSLLQGKFTSANTNGLYIFNIESSNSCYSSVNDQLSFDVIEKKYPTADLDKAALINSFSHEEGLNSLTIKFNVPNETVITTCAALSSYAENPKIDFSEPENSAGAQDENFRLARTASYSATPTEQTLQFQNMTRLGSGFVIKCMIMNGLTTILPDKNKVDFSIGSSPEHTYDKRIKITFALPSPSQCGIWTLETEKTDLNILSSKVKDYCEKLIANYNIEQKIDNLNENGCIQCEKYSPSEPKKFGLCIRSSETCPSNFKKGKTSLDFFKELISSIDTKEKLNAKLENAVVDDEVVSVLHQNYEEEIPNDNSITAEIMEKSKLKISNVLKRAIQCKTTTQLSLKTDINKEKEEDMTMLFDSSVIELPAGKNVEYTYLPEPSVEGLYQVVLQCYNLPFYQYHYKTFLVLANVMLWTIKQIPTIKEEKPHNCSDGPETTFTGQCVDYMFFPLELDTKDLIPNVDKLVFEFNQISFEKKILYLDIEREKMKAETNNELILNNIGRLAKLVSSLSCSDKLNYYGECRKIKQSQIESLYTKLQETFPPANQVVDTFKKFTNQEQAALSLAYAIYYISSSPESYNDKSYAEYPPLASKYIQQMPKIFSELTISTTIKGEIARLISGYVVNGYGYAKYFNEEKGAKVDDIGVYTEPNIIQIKNDFEIAHRLLVYGNVKDFNLDFLHVVFANNDDFSDLKEDESNKVFVFEGGKVNISIPVSIFQSPSVDFDLDLVGIFYYSDYFLLSPSVGPYLATRVYGVRYYKNKEEKSFDKDVAMDYFIYVDHPHTSDMFKKFKIEKNFKSFVYSNIGATEASGEVALFDITRDGDYIIGRNEGSVAWMIVTFALVGSILIAGIAYFIYANVKRRTQNSQLDSVAPILQEK